MINNLQFLTYDYALFITHNQGVYVSRLRLCTRFYAQ